MPYYFRAYPVSLGDAFFVEDNGFRFLVDGGIHYDQIGEYLLNDGIDELDLVICTHLDADHVNGILGIIRNPGITVDRLWVPEAWKEKIAVAARDREGLVRLASLAASENERGMRRFGALRFSIEDALRLEEPIPGRYGSRETLTETDVTDEVLDEAGNTVHNILRQFRGNLSLGDVSKLNGLRSASNIIRTASRVGIETTFWRYTDRLELTAYGDFISINAEPTGTSSNTYINTGLSGLQVFAISQINKESLVFTYAPYETSQVFFASDSGFHFLKNPNMIIPELQPYSILTAPHHGSGDDDHERVYNTVKGRGLRYVRSDSINRDRLGERFLSIPSRYRYCTRCRYEDEPQTIEFNYTNGRFRTASRHCPRPRNC